MDWEGKRPKSSAIAFDGLCEMDRTFSPYVRESHSTQIWKCSHSPPRGAARIMAVHLEKPTKYSSWYDLWAKVPTKLMVYGAS